MDDEHTSAHTGDGPADDAVQAGFEQLQRAALDAVRAARAVLDAAESVLEQPAAAKVVADTVTSFARTASETVAGFAAGAWPPGSQGDGEPAPRGGDDDPDEGGPDAGFERIPVE